MRCSICFWMNDVGDDHQIVGSMLTRGGDIPKAKYVSNTLCDWFAHRMSECLSLMDMDWF